MLKTAKKYFKELEEVYIYELFNLAKIEHLKIGQSVTVNDNILFGVILSGQLKSKKYNISVSAGDYMGLFLLNNEKRIEFTAKENSTCIIIDQKAIDLLPKEVLIWITKKNFIFMKESLYKQSFEAQRLSEKIKSLEKIFLQSQIKKFNAYKSSQIVQHIVDNIPKLPSFTNILLNKITDDTLKASDIADYIKTDPSLAALILKTVNSAYYGLKQKILDIHKAVLYLGMNSLYQLIMNDALKAVFPQQGFFKEIHQKSAVISFFASHISEKTKKGNQIVVSTTSLFKYLGNVVSYALENKNQKFDVIVRDMNKEILATILLNSWNFPQQITDLVMWQKAPLQIQPSSLSIELRNNITILYLAESIYNVLINKFDLSQNNYINKYTQYSGLAKKFDKNLVASIVNEIITKTNSAPPIIKQFMEKIMEDKHNEYLLSN